MKTTGQRRRVIGRRGERIAANALEDYQFFASPLFEPIAFGDGKEGVDFYVEFELPGGERAFFLAQIKSTSGPIPTKRGLQIKVPKAKWNRLAEYRCPVYLIAVHEPTEEVFIAAALSKRNTGIARLQRRNKLHPTNLKLLNDEVAAYWLARPRQWTNSHFKP